MWQHLTLDDIQKMDRNYRREFVNSISGYKSANLIGTQNKEGQTNLAIFNSVQHIGANPPLISFILRPTTVARHTYENIVENDGYYTINLLTQPYIRQAHQTSAKYAKEVSEFTTCHFTPEYIPSFYAPFVQESPLKIGLQLEEEHLIRANDTRLIVGKVLHVLVNPDSLNDNGLVELEDLKAVALRGLDTYYKPQKIVRLSYARPSQELSEFNE